MQKEEQSYIAPLNPGETVVNVIGIPASGPPVFLSYQIRDKQVVCLVEGSFTYVGAELEYRNKGVRSREMILEKSQEECACPDAYFDELGFIADINTSIDLQGEWHHYTNAIASNIMK